MGKAPGEIKYCNLKIIDFERKARKLKSIKILHFMIVFDKFALKIETS